MKKRISIPLFIFLAILLCAITFMTTYVLLTDRKDRSQVIVQDPQNGIQDQSSYAGVSPEMQKIINKLLTIDSIYKEEFIGELDYDEILDYVIYGYTVGTKDIYSSYMNDLSYDDYQSQSTGDMVGIGIHVILSDDGNIEVVNIFNGSPALEAGIEVGDIIFKVGDTRVTDVGYSDAVNMMLGEEGTLAEFSVLRDTGGDEPETIEFKVPRKKIESQNVDYHMCSTDSSIGIVRIDSFNGKTASQFINAIEDLRSQGADKFVFDVRNNPGGDLGVICEALDYLLPEGPIIRILETIDDENPTVIYSDAESYLNLPIAVLINGNTASAAELFTSALIDYTDKGLMNATAVGTTTYGKGIMQSIIDLRDGTAIKLSTSLYNPPFSDNYDGIGVVPDVEVDLDENLKNINIYKIKDEEDNQLAEAVRILQNQHKEND